jgi:hypothetical protein
MAAGVGPADMSGETSASMGVSARSGPRSLTPKREGEDDEGGGRSNSGRCALFYIDRGASNATFAC